MKTTARQPEPQVTFSALLGAGLSRLGMTIVRNPVAVGGATAFLVSFAFVSANALWYQPHSHKSALISTRAPAWVEEQPEAAVPELAPKPTPAPAERQMREPAVELEPREPSSDTTGAITPEQPAAETEEAGGGDATIRSVQKVLVDLGLYHGAVDGLQGPQTREAIGNYRRIVGLEPSEKVDEALLRQLGLVEDRKAESATVPAPTPRPSLEQMVEQPAPAPVQTASLDEGAGQADAQAEADPTIMRIQAGLKAFGNDNITVDGVLGESTRAAIREFQSLFGLPETGTPDEAFLAKMREVGLTN